MHTGRFATFYGLLGLLTALQLILRKVLIGREFHPGRRATFKRIPGLPPQIIVYFCDRSTAHILILGHLAALLLGCTLPGETSVRILVSLVFSCFAILDTANINTASYPSLYICAAMAFTPARYAEAFGAAATVHFFVAAGVAKLAVGGIEWMNPLTMRSYIRMVHETVAFFKRVGMYKCDIPPALPDASMFLITLDSVTLLLAVTTIIFEILIVPLSFLLLPDTRLPVMLATCVSFHVGIAMLQSVWVGMCFIPCLAFYVYGFGCPLIDPFTETGPFWAGVVFSLQSLIYFMMTSRILPSKWPLNPIALYALSGVQFEYLLKVMVRGTSRIALTTEEGPQLGSPILNGVLSESARATHRQKGMRHVQFDAFQNCANFTVFNHGFFSAMQVDEWDPLRVERHVGAWLLTDRLICEGVAGQLLRKAWHVVS